LGKAKQKRICAEIAKRGPYVKGKMNGLRLSLKQAFFSPWDSQPLMLANAFFLEKISNGKK